MSEIEKRIRRILYQTFNYRIDSQLETATKSFLEQEVEVFNKGINKHEVVMTKLFLWYGKDFGADEKALLEWVSSHLGEDKRDGLDEALKGEFTVIFKDYDWEANSSEKK